MRKTGEGMTAEEYRALLEVDLSEVSLEELRDVSKIRIDRTLPKEERMQQYIRKTVNPYLVRVGNMKIKIRFANNGVSFDQAFENMLLMTG